jgi:hypothetical protein
MTLGGLDAPAAELHGPRQPREAHIAVVGERPDVALPMLSQPFAYETQRPLFAAAPRRSRIPLGPQHAPPVDPLSAPATRDFFEKSRLD